MNILVTGGAGYLGSVLVPRLVQQGHTVAVLDWCHGRIEASIRECKSHALFLADICDVLDDDTVTTLTNRDAVIHLAALRLEACEANPAEAFRVNTEGTRHVLRAAEQAGVKRFIFASTCSVYGIAEGIATEDTPRAPTTIYAQTKIAAEDLVMASPIGVVLRFGTLYGPSPNMRYDTLINALAREIALGGSYELRDPESWRAFLHVEDAATMVERVLAIEAWRHRVLNVVGWNITKRHLGSIVKDFYPDFDLRLVGGEDARSYRVRSHYIGTLSEHTISGSLVGLVQHIRKANYEKASR